MSSCIYFCHGLIDFYDTPEIRAIMIFVLESSGCSVRIATNGAECLSMAVQHSFDVIIMDLQWPILYGYEAARWIRAKHMQLPIFALTAHAMRGDRENPWLQA